MEGLDAKTLLQQSGLELIFVKIGRRGISAFLVLVALCWLLKFGSEATSDREEPEKDEKTEKKPKKRRKSKS